MKPSTQRSLRFDSGFFWVALAVSSSMPLLAQNLPVTPPDRPPHDRADITHVGGGTVEFAANNPRPLAETVLALSEEYGWQVDYEDPVYDPGTEIADSADPAWRTSHPDEAKIVLPNGGSFRVKIAEPTGSDREVSESRALHTVVAAYNQTASPGRFFLESEPGGRIAVVGVSKSVGLAPEGKNDAFLSTKISLPVSSRTLGDTINAILGAATEKCKVPAQVATGPSPRVMAGDIVTVGGDEITARELLRQSLDQTGRTWLWSMLYEPTYGEYYLNIFGVVAAVVDSNGRRHLESVDPKPEQPRNSSNRP